MVSHNSSNSGNTDAVASLGSQGQLILNNGFFNVPGDLTASEYVLRAKTTDATPTPLLIDGVTATNKITLKDNQSIIYDALIIGRSSTGTTGAYHLRGTAKRGAGVATVAVLGTTNQTVLAEDVPAWDTTITADTTNGALNFNVIGAAATTIDWAARIRTVEMIL